ncbi:ATP-binding protein, partial [Candidatus Woesearchaeota archaeon]|nr:ATP-binding protein [Candidatus Woesearchaeota archaeon]
MESELWYQKLGFYHNPFSIKPAAFHSEVIGYDVEEVFSKIDSGSVVFVKGSMGVGKTTMLKHILGRFGGKGKVIYCTCNSSDKALSFRKLLIGSSFLSRLASSPAKNMILLVDEAQDIKKQETAQILRFFKKGNFKSVVFFGTDYRKEKFVPELHEMAWENMKALARLKNEHAVELVRKRVGDLDMISDETIRKVYRLSSYNPRKLLENCEDLFKHAVDGSAKKITAEHIKEVVKAEKPKRHKARKAPQIIIEQIEDVDRPLNIKPLRHKKGKPHGEDYGIRTYEEEMEGIKPLNE